ncbi:MAG TPA: asparaginase, partial [Thermoanaerobaculia bacterium]|nr:asparaginase [Thermoanaerobaculia bacterium]
LMRATLAEFAGIEPEEIPIAIDGCGVPAFFLTLYRAAFAYARLMAPPEQYESSARHVVASMTGFPHYVAGNWSLTTPLMAAFNGDLVAKEGAEGFYAMALSPALCATLSPRLNLAPNSSLGIALKVDDGSMDRGRNPVILRVLELLGVDVDARGLQREWPLRNHAGTLVGDVRSEFDLEVL